MSNMKRFIVLYYWVSQWNFQRGYISQENWFLVRFNVFQRKKGNILLNFFGKVAETAKISQAKPFTQERGENLVVSDLGSYYMQEGCRSSNVQWKTQRLLTKKALPVRAERNYSLAVDRVNISSGSQSESFFSTQTSLSM